MQIGYLYLNVLAEIFVDMKMKGTVPI